MRIHALQHVDFEEPSLVAEWAARRGHALATTHLYLGTPLPAHDEYDLLLVLGGPMNVDEHERHPWLIDEKAFIGEALDLGKGVLGICLGAQLMAAALGAPVARNAHREIGWFTVTLRPEARQCPLIADWPALFTAFHWHGDTFALPDGAVWLASSEACANQGFAWGPRAIGLQFHLEYTAGSIRSMLTSCEDELVDGPYVQTPAEMLGGIGNVERSRVLLESLLTRLEAAVAARVI